MNDTLNTRCGLALLTLALAGLFVLPTGSHAQTIAGTGWKGTSGTNWSTNANWDAISPGNNERNLLFGQGYSNAGGTSATANNDLVGYNGYRITLEIPSV